MDDIYAILCGEISNIIKENEGRLFKSIEHIQLSHDKEYFIRYVDGEQNKYGRYLKGHSEPYKNDMRDLRNMEFKVTIHGKIND